MKFRGNRARANGTIYEIHFSSYLNGKAVDPYYVDIIPSGSKRAISTEMTHRFTSESSAQEFCQSIAEGKILLNTLHTEQIDAYHALIEAEKARAQREAKELVSEFADLGVSFHSALQIFKSLSSASPEAKEIYASMASMQDPVKMIQENIVNISMKANEMLLQKGIDLDRHQGFQGLTDFIIDAAKQFELNVWSKADHNALDGPDYWEAIDDFAEKMIQKEYELELNALDHQQSNLIPIAEISYHFSGETIQYHSEAEFIKALKEALNVYGPNGVATEILDEENWDLRYEKESIIYGEFGEDVPPKEEWISKMKALVDDQGNDIKHELNPSLDAMVMNAAARKGSAQLKTGETVHQLD